MQSKRIVCGTNHLASASELSCPSFAQGVHTRHESQEDVSGLNVFDDKVTF